MTSPALCLPCAARCPCMAIPARDRLGLLVFDEHRSCWASTTAIALASDVLAWLPLPHLARTARVPVGTTQSYSSAWSRKVLLRFLASPDGVATLWIQQAVCTPKQLVRKPGGRAAGIHPVGCGPGVHASRETASESLFSCCRAVEHTQPARPRAGAGPPHSCLAPTTAGRMPCWPPHVGPDQAAAAGDYSAREG